MAEPVLKMNEHNNTTGKMMNTEELPVGKGRTPLEYPHFPTRWQAFVWRNWELVSPEKIAAV